MTARDIERREALITLLGQPDPPFCRRASHLTMEGRPDRHAIVPELSMSFIAHQRMAEVERLAAGE